MNVNDTPDVTNRPWIRCDSHPIGDAEFQCPLFQTLFESRLVFFIADDQKNHVRVGRENCFSGIQQNQLAFELAESADLADDLNVLSFG